GGILCVVQSTLIQNVCGLWRLISRFGSRIENCKTIFEAFALLDQRVLHDLIGGSRRANDADLINVFEGSDAGMKSSRCCRSAVVHGCRRISVGAAAQCNGQSVGGGWNQ